MFNIEETTILKQLGAQEITRADMIARLEEQQRSAALNDTLSPAEWELIMSMLEHIISELSDMSDEAYSALKLSETLDTEEQDESSEKTG